MKKKMCGFLCMFLLICTIFPNVIFSSNVFGRKYYPGTFAITYESVTGDELIDTYKVGGNIYYVYPLIGYDAKHWKDSHYIKYVTELVNSEKWRKVSEDSTVGELIYSRDGYVLQLNLDKVNEKITISVYKDKDGKYEVIDNSIITVYVNGERVYFDVEPQLVNGRTMVPMRAIFEALDCDVQWDEKNQQITATKEVDDIVTKIEMQIDSNYMIVEGEEKILDVTPILIDGRTLVPVRAISEALGVNVKWHNPILAVDIYSEKRDMTVLYNANGDIVHSPSNLLKKYQNAGWYTEPVVIMYKEDGTTAVFKKTEIEYREREGWYTEPVQRLYAPGKSALFKESEIEGQLKVGWYKEPVKIVYAADGRTLVVKESEIEAYENVGWYQSKIEAVLSKYHNYNVVIYSVDFRKNSVGGIEPEIELLNLSTKTVKYVYITAVPYNAVGDIVSSEIGGKTSARLQITGPIESGTAWTSSWAPVWYNYSVNNIKITKIEVIYMDGTSEILSNPPIIEKIL